VRSGIAVHRLATRPVVDGAAAVRLVRLARRLGLGASDALLAWGRSQASLAAAVKLLLPRLPCIGHLAVPPRGMLAAAALRQVDRVIASSAGVAAACRRAGVAAAKIDTIPPGAEAAAAGGLARAELATRLGLDREKLWTLCVAPLEAESRLERLLWAIDQLGVVHRRLEHVLVGGGPLRERLLRRARAQRVDERLHLFDHLDCLPDLLREARLVWQSGEVACGGGLLDAMALGIPTVAVVSDASRQLVVDAETGRLVPADPESEFPRRALGIIEDDALAARYGAAARTRAAAELPVERMVAGIIAAAGG
jgi:rhamnosyl/mannosyltransferase